MTRTEKISYARELRAEGLTAREIAERVDAPVSTVRNWYLGGTCECGAPMDGSSKRAQEAKRCNTCNLKFRSSSIAERDERVRVLWEEGMPVMEIARSCGLTVGLVYSIVHNNFRERRGIKVSLRKLPTETNERYGLLERLVYEGWSNTEIAEAIGTVPKSVGSMISRARKLGWDVPYRRALGTLVDEHDR